MTLDEFVAIMLIVAIIPVAIIQWMGLIVKPVILPTMALQAA